MCSKCSAYPVLEGFSDMPISRQKSWNKKACSVTITQRNLWKPWDSAANDPTFFDDCSTVYKCKQKPRGRCNSVSAMLIEHRPFLTLHQKSLIIFSYILKAKYIFELGRWIANLPEKWEWIHFKVVVYIDNLHANTCHFSLHKLEWRHRTRLVSGLRRRSGLASVSPCGGGYGYTWAILTAWSQDRNPEYCWPVR